MKEITADVVEESFRGFGVPVRIQENIAIFIESHGSPLVVESGRQGLCEAKHEFFEGYLFSINVFNSIQVANEAVGDGLGST